MTSGRDEHWLYEEYAVRHVMGGLGDNEAQVFRSHLLECDECRLRVGELRSIASELADVERAERREKAARTLETKQRDEQTPEAVVEDATAEAPRRGRAGLVLAAIVIGLLALWNITLHGHSDELQAALEAERAAAAVINFGDPWTNQIEAAGIDGVVRVDGRDLAVMVDGTDDRVTYAVSFLTATGAVLRSDQVASADGRVRYLTRDLSAGAVRVDVSQPSGGGSSIVLRAVAPPPGE